MQASHDYLKALARDNLDAHRSQAGVFLRLRVEGDVGWSQRILCERLYRCTSWRMRRRCLQKRQLPEKGVHPLMMTEISSRSGQHSLLFSCPAHTSVCFSNPLYLAYMALPCFLELCSPSTPKVNSSISFRASAETIMIQYTSSEVLLPPGDFDQ